MIFFLGFHGIHLQYIFLIREHTFPRAPEVCKRSETFHHNQCKDQSSLWKLSSLRQHNCGNFPIEH